MAESRGPTVDGVAIAFAILTAIVISLRLCARAFIVKSVGVDDGKHLTFFPLRRDIGCRLT